MNPNINQSVQFQHLGLIDYQQAWDYQTQLFQRILDIKAHNRHLPPGEQVLTPNFILFCQHPHVYTLGRNGKPENLLCSEAELREIGADFTAPAGAATSRTTGRGRWWRIRCWTWKISSPISTNICGCWKRP